MPNETVAIVLTSAEKHALRIIAAEANMNLSEYIRKVLRDNTQMDERARTITRKIGQLPVREKT